MIVADPKCGEFQGFDVGLVDGGDGRVDFVLREGHGLGRQVQTVKFRRQFDHGLVAARADVGDDGRNGVIDIGRILALHGQKRGKFVFEVLVSRVQKLRHDISPTGRGFVYCAPSAESRRRTI